MKILKIEDNYFEVLDQHELENAAAVCLKVNRCLTSMTPVFTFGYESDKFFNIPYTIMSNAIEVSEQDFQDQIKSRIEYDWTLVFQDEKNANGEAFLLRLPAQFSREAFRKTFLDIDFKSFICTLREKVFT